MNGPTRRIHRDVSRASLMFVVLLALASSGGCSINMLAIPYFLFAGEPKIDPPVTLCKNRKDTRRVLVLTYADTSIQWGYRAIDDELTVHLVNRIAGADSRLEVVPERAVREWKDRDADWIDKDPQAIGEYFDVDYVLFVEVTSFSLNTTRNQFLLQGHADVLFKVWDVNTQDMIFTHVLEKDYPTNRSIELQDVSSEEQFRRIFLRRLAEELSWYVVPHKVADEIEDV